MRYLVLVLLSVVGVLLNGSFFSGLGGNIHVDVILLMMIAFVFLDKTSMPIIFGAASGVLVDMLYSSTIGITALAYTLTAALALIFTARLKRPNPLWVFVFGAAGMLLKELIVMIIIAAMGVSGGFGKVLVLQTLPSALLAGGLVYIPWFFFQKLYKKNWMRPREVQDIDDLEF